MSTSTTSILFVCMGNICRSPAAECLFRAVLEERVIANLFEVDSAGTGGWHVGAKPDRRMRAAAKRHGVSIDGSARQVTVDDFTRYDWIFCMDQDNYEELVGMGANPQKTTLLLSFVKHPTLREVPDPYYGGDDGFDQVLCLIDDAVHQLVDMLT